MKKILLPLCLVAVMSLPAYAEDAAPAPAPAAEAPVASPAPGNMMMREKMRAKMDAMPFDQKKARALDHLSKRLAKTEERKACITAATDAAAMKKCYPDMGERRKQGKSMMEKCHAMMRGGPGGAMGKPASLPGGPDDESSDE